MTTRRPRKRFTVFVKDGLDTEHVITLRARDGSHAEKLALRNVARKIKKSDMADMLKTLGVQHMRTAHTFAGHVRPVDNVGAGS